jgi:hypothetical protein
MALRVTIDSIVGVSPFDIYICQPNGTGCFYIDTITTAPFEFDIPSPYDTSSSYMLKVVDAFNCTITGIQNVII